MLEEPDFEIKPRNRNNSIGFSNRGDAFITLQLNIILTGLSKPPHAWYVAGPMDSDLKTAESPEMSSDSSEINLTTRAAVSVLLSTDELELSDGGAKSSISKPTMNRFMDSLACDRLPFPPPPRTPRHLNKRVYAKILH